jgi:hypothetical protein
VKAPYALVTPSSPAHEEDLAGHKALPMPVLPEKE